MVEAQRLGLRSFGSDLNPVPVLISRTLTEVLPRVWGQQPLYPEANEDRGLLLPQRRTYAGYEGLTSDVLHYAERVNDHARAILSAHYPEQPGETPIAWLWARTAKCTNPACGVETVLTTSWWLSKRRRAMAWLQPGVVDGQVQLDVVTEASSGGPSDSPKVGRGANFACVACGALLTEDALIAQGRGAGLGLRMTAVLSEDGKRRVFRAPTEREAQVAEQVPSVDDLQDIRLADIPRWFSGPRFGLTYQTDLYTKRQLHTLATFADLVRVTYDEVLADGGSPEWACAVTTVLGIGVGKLAHYGSSQTRMELATGTSNGGTHPAFGRNDLPMTWDFAETNPFGGRSGGWLQYLSTSLRAIEHAPHGTGTAVRADARVATVGSPALVATDPPYFDAIGYADLSDYFYLWHRRCLRNVHPDLYSTIAAPREGELTAVPAHHGNSPQNARDYFVSGFTETFQNLQAQSQHGLPLVVVYASKEQKAGVDEETRWESILTAMVAACLEITGTWPIHGTGSSRMISLGTNSVATYVAMIARPRDESAGVVSLGDFSRALRRDLGPAIRALQGASILPVDMGQAVLGPGMSIFSRHAMVTDQSGERVSVAQAIRLINTVARELQEEQEGELDQASQFALTLWQLNGWDANSFDTANRIARPKGISVDEVVRAGVATSRANKVSLLGRSKLDRGWRPDGDSFPTAWEAVHHLIDRLVDGGGETDAGDLLRAVQEVGLADSTRLLTYRLATVAANTSRTRDEERYNALIDAWPRLQASAGRTSERLF